MKRNQIARKFLSGSPARVILGVLLLFVALVVIVGSGHSNAPRAQAKPVAVLHGAHHGGFVAGGVSAPIVSELLTSTNGTWTNSPTSFSYAWERCNSSGGGCVPISGATSSTYTVATADVGHEIASLVTAINASGSATQESNLSGVVTSGGSFHAPPANGSRVTLQFYGEIGSGGSSLPAYTAAYPAPGSANIWETDMFADSNTNGGVPTGPSPVAQALHAAGKYSICYIEAGAQQAEPDSSNFAVADYKNGSNLATTQMVGYPGENWYDTRGFASYVAGDNSTLTGAAVNIAAGMATRIKDCAIEGQDALDPDDLVGYTTPSQTGAPGGGWGLTQTDAAGYDRWLAYTAHSLGLAVFQKNDTANISADEPLFDGAITEDCAYYDDPCSEWQPYLSAHKPVLETEYTHSGWTTANFCAASDALGITAALFDRNLASGTYGPCQPGSGYIYPG